MKAKGVAYFAEGDIEAVGSPNEIVIPAKLYARLIRPFMTRRGYRRWRARRMSAGLARAGAKLGASC